MRLPRQRGAPWRAHVLGSQIAELLCRPGRAVTTGVSVLVAAFAVFAAIMAQQITTNTTLDTFRGTPKAVDLVARAGDSALGASALQRIRALPGVAEAVGRVDAGAPVAGATTHWLELRSDPGEGPLSQLRVVEGSYPDRAGELAVNRRAAAELGLAPGSRTVLELPDAQDAERTGKVTVTVTGVVESTATAEQRSGGYTTDAFLLPLAGAPGYERVDIRAEAGASTAGLTGEVRAVLGGAGKDSAEAGLVTGDAVRAAEKREAVGGDLRELFRLISVFLAVAVGAAALVATSAFRIVFAQRARQTALLRAIGASRHSLVTALFAEGAVVGALAGTLGVLLALGAGHLAPTAARVLAGQELSAPGFPVAAAGLVVAGTVLLSAGSVLAPALSTARIPPVQVLRGASTAGGERRTGPGRLTAGLVLACTASGIVVLLLRDLPGPDEQDYDRGLGMLVTVLSAGLAFLALISLGPLLVRPLLAVTGWPLRRLGATGKLAVSGVGGSPRRAAAVSVVVALGVALVSGALVVLACLTGYDQRKEAVDTPADFRITTEATGLDAALVRRLAALPELSHVTAYRTVRGTAGQGVPRLAYEVSDLAPNALPTGRYLGAADGSLSDLGPGRAVLASGVAEAIGVRAGDSFTLAAGRAEVRLSVAATLPEEGPGQADILVVPADLNRLGAKANADGLFADAAASGLTARAEAGRALQAVLRDHAPDPDGVSISVLADDRDNRRAGTRSMGVTALGLVALTVLVAIVGVTATTSLTAIERAREFGLLRALGLSGGALRRTITVEAGLYGVLGACLGLALGVPYAVLLVRLTVADAPLVLPRGWLLLLCGGLIALTALAGLFPAHRATRVPPMAALGGAE